MGTPGDVPPSVAIVEAVAEAEGVAPIDLQPPLATVVNPDALDRLFTDTPARAAWASGRVSLRYCGHDVELDTDGRVVVDGTAVETAPGFGDAPGRPGGD